MKHFDSTVFRASQELLEYLQKDYVRPLDQAHSVLTQGFHIPARVATAILKRQIPCHSEKQSFVISLSDFENIINEHPH